jgi:hypothetical protein
MRVLGQRGRQIGAQCGTKSNRCREMTLQPATCTAQKFRPISKPDRSERKTIRLTFIYMCIYIYVHRCLTGAVGDVEFEFVVEMNLVQIGTNEFFPQLIRHAAKRKAPTVPPVQQPELRDAIKVQRLLNSSWPSRGHPFPPVFVMEAAENHASRNLAVLGKGMFVVILHRWEYRGTFRNPRSEVQMRAALVVMSNPVPRQNSAPARISCV